MRDAFAATHQVTIVAPDREYSGCGHQVTNHAAIRVESLGQRCFKVYGTPADCARVALTKLATDADWLLSGINDGGNMGVDLYMSGTVAAAREATWLGVPAIAFSQYSDRNRDRDWPKSTRMSERVWEYLHQGRTPSSAPPDHFWNVNLPDVDTAAEKLEICETFTEPLHLGVDFSQDSGQYRFQSDYRNRPRTEGSDVSVCFGGHVAITRIRAVG